MTAKLKSLVGKELGIAILLILLVAISATINPNFISPNNLQNTGNLIGIYGIFSIGLGLVIITGGIDLSVGSLFALLGVMFSIWLTKSGLPPALAFFGVMFLAAGIGLAHGTLITKVKMQPFIVTLCGLLLYRGLARYIADDNTLGFGKAEGFEWLKQLSTGAFLGVPNPLWVLMVVATIMFFVLHRTSFGRYLFAVGANEEAARYAGIPSARIITIAYVLCSLLAGLASVLLGFYTNSISPSAHGNFYELYAIAAAVLGGCSLRGGEGSIIGILLGTALLQALRNMVNLLKIPSSLEFAVMGVVILLGVLADSLVRKKKV